MKYFSKIAIGLTLSLTILLPQSALAANGNTNRSTNSGSATTATSATCDELKQKFENANGGDVIAGAPKYCNVESVYTKIVNFLLYFLGIAAVIAIIYGGYIYMTAGGDEFKKRKAKSVLTWAIIGVIVVITAAVLVNVVVKALVENPVV